jgi:hypothetical protein
MNCNNIQIKLIDYLEKRLSADEVMVVSNHLKSCLACAGQFKFIEQTYGLIDEEMEMPINPFFYSKVITRLDTQLIPNKNLGDWIQWLKPVGIAASMMIGFYIGSYEVLQESETTSETEIAEELLLPAEYEDMLLTFSE